MPGILTRYILRETIQTWFVVTVVLLLILVTNQFAAVLGDAASSRLPKDAVFRVMGLTSVQYLTILVPVGLFLSILLALGRLYRDSEMSALMACGIGPVSLYRPLVMLALLLAGIVGWLAVDVSPSAIRTVQAIAAEMKQTADLRLLEPGRFITFGDTDAVLYAEAVDDDGSLRNVFVQRRTDTAVEVIVAARAWQSDAEQPGTRVLRFANGRRYEGEPGGPQFRIVSFREHGIPYAVPKPGPVKLKPESKPLMTLLASADPVDMAEIQWRLSVPLGLLVLTVLAVPLSRSSPRQGRYSGLVAGVLIYVIYVNLLGAAKVWTEQGDVPPLVGMWWVHLLFLAAAGLMLARQYGLFHRLVVRPAPESRA